MDTFAELQLALQSDLNVSSTSTLFDPATIKLALNRAYRRAGGLYLWPETEDAKKTSTVNLQEYYDYPTNWKPDSVWKILVDSQNYGEATAFKDYLYEKENNMPSGKTYMWSSQWRRFFIYPTPTTDGNNNISIWGQKVVDKMVNDTDVTIFSYSLPECNDAIVMEATTILKSKAEDKSDYVSRVGNIKSLEAQGILKAAWDKIRENQMKYEKTTPFLDVPNMFPSNTNRSSRPNGSSNGSPIGNF